MIQSEEESFELNPFQKKFYQQGVRRLTPYSQHLISEQDIYYEEYSTYFRRISQKMEFSEEEWKIIPPLWFGLLLSVLQQKITGYHKEFFWNQRSPRPESLQNHFKVWWQDGAKRESREGAAFLIPVDMEGAHFESRSDDPPLVKTS